MIASEAQPFSKTGGLADVAAALPRALGRLGHDVTVMTPRYRGVPPGEIVGAVALELASYAFRADLHEVALGPGARAVLVDCPELYDRPGIYNEGGRDYPDNALRYAFLSAAAVDWASQQSAKPFDILHAHDWQSGLVPVYARALLALRHQHRPGTVFTIHNLAYQGLFDKTWVPRLGLRMGGLHDRRFRVLRPAQFSEGRARVLECDHDREPDLRRRNPAARIRRWP